VTESEREKLRSCHLPKKIIVVGTSGCGKTTFCRKLSQTLSIPHIELDALFWQSNWVQVPKEIFHERISQATEGATWILDGNWSGNKEDVLKEKILELADTFIWLDYSFPLIFWRGFSRTIRRAIFQEKLWAGNTESLRQTFFSKNSMLWWMVKTYSMRKKQYSAMLSNPSYQHLKGIRLTNPKQTERYLSQIK